MMKKRVSDLTPDEFKRTFPIILKEHNASYKEWYENAKQEILRAVKAEQIARINHVGSSAVESLIAKPTIDMLLEMDGCCDVTALVEDLKAIGFGDEISTRSEDPLRILLCKGYSVDGCEEKVYHLHVRYLGDWDELYFRDFLMANPDVAAEYGALKLRILDDIEKGVIERLPNGMPNGYSKAKIEFVREYSNAAKQEYRDRYRPR